MKRTRQIKCLASLSVVLSIMLSLVQVNAFAVTQFELDEIRKEKNKLTAQREQCQTEIDELQAKQASALEQKAALDERNQYALKQVRLISEQVELDRRNQNNENKKIKPNVLRVIRIKEDAIRELVYETFMEKGRSMFDMFDDSKIVFDISFDMDAKDLICAIHDENSFREYGSVDFEKISSVVEETTTSVYSSKPYIDLEVNDGVYKTKQQ